MDLSVKRKGKRSFKSSFSFGVSSPAQHNIFQAFVVKLLEVKCSQADSKSWGDWWQTYRDKLNVSLTHRKQIHRDPPKTVTNNKISTLWQLYLCNTHTNKMLPSATTFNLSQWSFALDYCVMMKWFPVIQLSWSISSTSFCHVSFQPSDRMTVWRCFVHKVRATTTKKLTVLLWHKISPGSLFLNKGCEHFPTERAASEFM